MQTLYQIILFLIFGTIILLYIKKRSDHRLQERAVDELNGLIRDHSIDLLHLHDRYREVFELYSHGVTVEEISRKLGFGKGELELILQLAGEK